MKYVLDVMVKYEIDLLGDFGGNSLYDWIIYYKFYFLY